MTAENNEIPELVPTGKKALRLADRPFLLVSVIERPAVMHQAMGNTPTHLPRLRNPEQALAEAKAAATQACKRAVNAMRIAPSQKKAAKEAWTPAISTRRQRKTQPDLLSYEQTSIVDRIRPRHLIDVAVIIDILRGDLIKHHIRPSDQAAIVDRASVVEHYLQKYMEICKQGVDVYLSKMAQKHIDMEKISAQVAAEAVEA